jgi:hypothetical protein
MKSWDLTVTGSSMSFVLLLPLLTLGKSLRQGNRPWDCIFYLLAPWPEKRVPNVKECSSFLEISFHISVRNLVGLYLVRLTEEACKGWSRRMVQSSLHMLFPMDWGSSSRNAVSPFSLWCTEEVVLCKKINILTFRELKRNERDRRKTYLE